MKPLKHFYEPPPDNPDPPCGRCGKPLSRHQRRCTTIWSVGTEPGFWHCRLVEDHDGPHEVTCWVFKGVVYSIDKNHQKVIEDPNGMRP